MKVVILAGGGGTRLFPVSTEALPKQFMKVINDESILVNTVRRFADLVDDDDIIIVTGEKYRILVAEEMKQSGLEAVHILCEPEARNTAPAIVYAARYCHDVLKCAQDEVLFVAPADHVIGDNKSFCINVEMAARAAQYGALVTFGIKPTAPETGFGYIQACKTDDGIFDVSAFKEKPDYDTALAYLAAGNYYWNSGMFILTLGKVWEELALHDAYMYALCARGFDYLTKEFRQMPAISFDYAIAEKSDNIKVIPFSPTWSDIGSWDALYDYLPHDSAGNATRGDTEFIDCGNNLFFGRENHTVVGVGVNDLVVVAKDNITLVFPRGESQRVKEVYDMMKNRIKLEDDL